MAIRVGLIGLSAKAKTSWASSAHLPYLQASGGKYAIVALCNSSVTAAQSAIEAYDLPASTKAYGNPQDLAEDPQVDLVVCTTRVDLHYDTIKPSLVKGKDVYCEWPLASNVENAEELYALAKENNARTVIGLQGQLSPIVLKVKSLIVQENKIGRVLSSSIFAAGGTRTRDSMIEGLKYFTRRFVGGNMVTIGFGHMIDFVMLVLGELSVFRSQLNILRPEVPIMASDGTILETVTTDVADHIMLQGILSSGAPLSVTFRRGPPFKGTPGFIWSVYGEKGEIRITAAGPALQANDDETTIAVHTFDQGVEVIECDRCVEDLAGPARNVAAMYEAFAAKETRKYPDFGHAVLRHRQIEEVFKCAEESTYIWHGPWHSSFLEQRKRCISAFGLA